MRSSLFGFVVKEASPRIYSRALLFNRGANHPDAEHYLWRCDLGCGRGQDGPINTPSAIVTKPAVGVKSE